MGTVGAGFGWRVARRGRWGIARAQVLLAAGALLAAIAPASAGTPGVVDGAQFGSLGYDGVFAVAADSTGTYLAGERNYVGGEQVPESAFIRQIRPDGTTGWKHGIRTGGYEFYSDVVTTDNAVYAVGATSGVIADPTQPEQPSYDGFVEKLRKTDGTRVWIHQIGDTAAYQDLTGVAVDATGVYVGGQTRAAVANCIPVACQFAGGGDGYVRKYTTTGAQVWTSQFGTVEFDYVAGLTAQGAGVFVGGGTEGVLEAGRVVTGGREAFVRRFTAGGGVVWTRQFGPVDNAFMTFGQIDANSDGVYVTGSADARIDGTSYMHKGESDVYLRMYSLNGTLRDTRQFGSTGDDEGQGLATRDGAVFVTGSTDGDLLGAPLGGNDIWARRFTTSPSSPLAPTWQLHLGTADEDTADAVDAVKRGVYVAGETNGEIPGCSPACQQHGDFDAFWLLIH